MSAQIEMAGALSPRDGWVADRCPMAAALSVVSTRSAFLILREAFYGATRFEQFVSRTKISEPVAAARLKELEAAGLLERRPYRDRGQRTRHEYALTEKGAELLPVVVSLMRWGEKWALEADSRVELSHAGCGGQVGVSLACSEGHSVAADQIELVLKPSRRINASSSAT